MNQKAHTPMICGEKMSSNKKVTNGVQCRWWRVHIYGPWEDLKRETDPTLITSVATLVQEKRCIRCNIAKRRQTLNQLD